MLEVALMLEGQNGLNWPRFKAIATAAEQLGFAGLYRSDHYTNATAPEKDSLELWTSLAWLASHTQKLEFGPLVTPPSFRHPTMTARIARDIDDLSGGRLTLGLGAGWQEREHTMFGLDLLELQPRFQRFVESLDVITQLLNSDTPVNYTGQFYNLREAILLPRPHRPGGPPILIGGNGKKRTLRLAAQYASEWNAIFLSPAEFKHRCDLLDGYLAEANRPATAVKRSMMTGLWFGERAALEARAAERNTTLDAVKARGVIVGNANEILDQLGALADAGLQRIMLQWLDLDDLDGLHQWATAVIPHVHAK